MPSDSPTLAPFKPDWDMALKDAIEKRPELFMARQDVKAAQLQLDPRQELAAARRALHRHLRHQRPRRPARRRRRDAWTATATPCGAWPTATSTTTAPASAAIIPIGYRLAYTQVRRAQLNLARSLEVLKDQEGKAQNFLELYYRRLSLNYKQIQSTRAQREAFGELLKARSSQANAGKITLQDALEAQRFWADALASEFQAIVTYNNAIAGFEYGKGTILQHNNVHIAEGGAAQHRLRAGGGPPEAADGRPGPPRAGQPRR